ncbi:uncharacterized protein LOC126700671 [Quercus robur]|uniref:uncharacterized protein LOC126700671 n=1 Tax=Quercus robur TaxID=38942 RepID=UPI002162CE87|nr:uncharacterized protein LOC126700671 [Quercus robur]
MEDIKNIPPPYERFSQKLCSYDFRSVSEDARYFLDLLRDDDGGHWLKIKKKTLSTGRAYSIHIALRGLKTFYDAVSEALNSPNLDCSFNRRIEHKVFKFRRSPNTLKLVDNSVWIIVPDTDWDGFRNGLIQMLEVQDEGWSLCPVASGHWTQAIPQAEVRLATWFEDIQAEFRGLELHGNHFG